MKNLSLKMDEKVFQESEKILTKVRKNRNRYINDAVQFYNVLQKRRILKKSTKAGIKIGKGRSHEGSGRV